MSDPFMFQESVQLLNQPDGWKTENGDSEQFRQTGWLLRIAHGPRFSLLACVLLIQQQQEVVVRLLQ